MNNTRKRPRVGGAHSAAAAAPRACRRRGAAAAISLVALPLLLLNLVGGRLTSASSAFLPVVGRRHRRSSPPSALSYEQDWAGGRPGGEQVPPGGRSGIGDGGGVESLLRLRIADLESELVEARATLAARTEEVRTLRRTQAEHLARISELTASLAEAHREKEDALTDLATSQRELGASLGQVAELIQKVNDASGTLQRKDMERAAAAEKITLAERAKVEREEAERRRQQQAGRQAGQQQHQEEQQVQQQVQQQVVEKEALNGEAVVAEAVAAEEEKVASPKSAADGPEAGGDSSYGEGMAAAAEATTIPELNSWKLDGVCATGRVMNHPSIDDDEVIVTSPLTNPSAAAEGGIVTTESGSRYRLGKPQYNPPKGEDVDVDGGSPKGVSTLDLGMAKTKLQLTGETVGNGRYLLAGAPVISKHGRSEIWSAYRANGYGLPKGEALAIKVSTNGEAMTREDTNYKAVTVGLTRGRFVRHIEFLPAAGDSPPWSDRLALVMERGTADMKAYIERYGALRDDLLRDAVFAAVHCINAIHASNLVWTDLKAENFVVVEDQYGRVSFKGIDLESAMPVGDHPVDYSPEACPPEFAAAFLEDGGQGFVLDYSYDIWSLGTYLFELATGRGLFDGRSPLEVTKMLPEYRPDPQLFRGIADPKLADLISQCLQADSARRPTIAQVLAHPYLSSVGFGPFRFGG